MFSQSIRPQEVFTYYEYRGKIKVGLIGIRRLYNILTIKK